MIATPLERRAPAPSARKPQVEAKRLPALHPAAWIFAGIFLLRIVVLVRLTGSPFLLPGQGDMHFYNDWAQRILRGELSDGQAFYGLPLYPFLLASLYKLLGYSPFIPGLLQIAADSGTGVLLYKLAARVFSRSGNGQAIGLIAAAGWAVYIPAAAYSVILMPTALAVFVFWFVVWQIVKHDCLPPLRNVFLLGTVVGFSASGVATVLFLLPLVLAAVFLQAAPVTARLLRTAVLGIGLLLGVSPCAAHNYFIANERVLLSAHSGINLWIGNNPHANGYPRMPPGLHAGQEAMLQDSIDEAQQSAGRELKRSEVSRFWSSKAKAYMWENPGAWLRLVGTKIANFWNAFQYDDLSIITNLRLQGILLPGLSFGVVAALGLAGIAIAFNSAPRSRWVLAAVLLHMASLLMVFVTERYRLVAVPGLMIFAAFGLCRFWASLSRLRGRSAVAYLGCLAVATCLVSVPRKDPSLWALDPYNSGWQALDSKNFALAKDKLELAYAYVPNNAEVNFALGNLHLELGDTTRAKSFYRETLRIDSEHEGSWNNLGVLALEEERWELAIRFFQAALKVSPNDAKTHYLLARAWRGAGDLTNAHAAIEMAVRLEPAQPLFAEFQRSLSEDR